MIKFPLRARGDNNKLFDLYYSFLRAQYIEKKFDFSATIITETKKS